MKFCTVINCMDGRVQLPVIQYLQKRFEAEYVDSITEAGPNLILSDEKNTKAIQSIRDRVKISMEKHNSVGIAIVGHHDCAGNPAAKSDQLNHIENAKKLLRQHFKDVETIGLWVDENWKVHEINLNKPNGE